MSTRKKRRENDLPITWYINKKVGDTTEPFNLEGIPLTLEVKVGFKKYFPEFEVEDNGVIFTFWGKDQSTAGEIVLTLWGNYGQRGMWAIDTKEVTELVHHSWQETDNPAPVGVLVGGVELTSVISLERGPRGYSAYEIDVQHGFVGTEEEWLASLHPEITADANGVLYVDGHLLTVILKTVTDSVNAGEAGRVEAEEARVEAERRRVNAESARAEAETVRQNKETDRQTAETARASAETARANAETQRASAEEARSANEQTRVAAENSRDAAERVRIQNEQTRTSKETERQSAETARSRSESERITAEEARALAEDGRRTSENARIEAETARVAAETARVGAETARSNAESQRVENETTRQTAEGVRNTKEGERQSAESTRQTKESERQTAETTRQTQESTRQTKEGERQTAEGGRATAESGRVSAEQSRVAAEAAREEQSASDHQRAEADHAIAEEDHSTLDEKISHKADIDGSYDGMAVGIARNLEGRTDVTDSFFERTTGGDAEVANGTAQLNEVKGKSQVWNQLARNSVNTKTYNGVTITKNDDGSYTLSGQATENIRAQFNFFFNGHTTVEHKYYMSFFPEKRELFTTYGVFAHAQNVSPDDKGFGCFINAVDSVHTSSYTTVNVNAGFPAIPNIRVVPKFIDLTLLGIDNLETVEEVEAWLAENIGEQAYYPYNPGEVLNNRMTGVESIGFNLLDPATGKADIIGAYSDVYGNYYGITGTHGTLTFTDKFGNTETITPDSDGKFLLEKAGELSVADAGEDCAVFLWWDGTQTEYKPYEKNVGALDVTHIYGKLNGEGEYVRVWPTGMPGIGDIKDSLKIVDGQVVAERKVGEVDMGDIAPNSTGSFGTNSISYPSANSLNIATAKNKTPCKMACAKYPTLEYNSANDNGIGQGSSMHNIVIWDSALVSQTLAQIQTALAGVLLYYELATPAVYTDLIYRDSEAFADNTPVTLPVNYKVDNWGIERIAPQNTEEAVVTAKPELTMRYSIDAVEELNTHRDEIEDLYEKNEELDERKPEKYGEYPDMAVGSAKTLAGQDTKVEEFVFAPISAADGLAKLNSARGKSLVWNQIIRNGNFADGTNGWENGNGNSAISVSDNTLTIASIDENGKLMTLRQASVNIVANRKVYIAFSINPSENFSGRVSYSTYIPTPYTFTAEANKWTRVSCISQVGSNGMPSFLIYGTNAIMSWQIRNVILIDLTLMFGAGNEPSSVDEFEAMFPLPYYDYEPGKIISNKTEEVKVVGFNQWDEEVEAGGISTTNGSETTTAGYNRSKSFIPVFPDTQYNMKAPVLMTILEYDANKEFIKGTTKNSAAVFTTSANCRYLRFRNASANTWPTYNHDICINLSDPNRNGEYEPYKTNTIELNLPTLTGKLNGEGESVVVFPDGLKSAGSVYDEIVGNKAIKRIGRVDLGTLAWAKTEEARLSAGHYFVASVGSSLVKSGTLNKLCDKYPMIYDAIGLTSIIALKGESIDKVTFSTSSSSIYVIDSAYSDAATFKTAMSGVMLYYELATPEEYILDEPLPDTFQAYKGGTIKQLPENTSVPVTAPMVMTVTYAIDAVGTLVGLPRNYVSKESLQAMLNAMQSAGIIASYTMTYNENTGKYDFTFVAPSNS